MTARKGNMKPFSPKPATETTEEEAPKRRTRKKAGFCREGATILSAMEYLTRNIRKSGSCEDETEGTIDQTENEANAYLQERMSLTQQQVVLLTATMYANTRCINGCPTDALAQLLDMHPLRALGLEQELASLLKCGYLTKEGPDDCFWKVRPEARRALIDNRDFSLDELRLSDNIAFLQAANKIVKEGMRHDNNGSISRGIGALVEINSHLTVVRNLNHIELNNVDRWALLLMMTTIAGAGDNFINTRDLEQVLRAPDARRIANSICQGKYILVQKGYLEPYAEDGFAKADGWVLTRKAWTDMLENEEEVESLVKEDDQVGGLTPYADLKKRNLFFSHDMQQQVDRLAELLSVQRFNEVCASLDAKGLPKGFCCLFYGTPGTGKTELVQQLAIRTGRDLMQIDISQLRDKFVGESEKRLKAVFDSYRLAVKRSEKAPILFFNEADAIFGARMERTQHSVDKMENALQNIILQEMEKMEGIMICTTNLTSALDKAFERRFLYKIEFDRPNAEARKHIWLDMIGDLTDEQAQQLADRYDFSGGQIQNISRKTVIQQVFSGCKQLDYDQLILDCNSEKLCRSNGHRIGF